MTICNTLSCPNCGGELKHYDSVDRLVRSKGGVKNRIKIRRLRCTKCRKLHRSIPCNLLPYKHYDADIIDGVVEGYITPDTIGYEDYPCELTMQRWKRAKNTRPLTRKI